MKIYIQFIQLFIQSIALLTLMDILYYKLKTNRVRIRFDKNISLAIFISFT